MNILSICALCVVTAVMIVLLKPKNGEIALMLSVLCCTIILLAFFLKVSEISNVINKIIASANISTNYISILLKVIGICIVTEFTSNVCKDAGSASLSSSVLLAGKIMVTVCSLPLYCDILNVVLSLMGG